MVYKNGYAIPDANRQNSLDRRLNGVVDFDPSTHIVDTGPCNVTPGSSSTAVESDVDAGTVQIGGDPVEVTQTSVAHEAGDADYPRHDVVWIAADGSANVLTGAPGDNAMVDADGDLVYPTGPNAPNPQTQDGRRLEGTVLASVWVPAGATDTSALSLGEHYHDRRRPAIPIPRDPYQQRTYATEMQAVAQGTYAEQGFLVEGGHSVSLWSFEQMNNIAEWDRDWGVRFQLVEYTGGDGTVTDNIEWHISLSAAYRRDSDTPIARVDVPSGEEYRRFAIRQRNYNHPLSADEQLSCTATLTIDPLTG